MDKVLEIFNLIYIPSLDTWFLTTRTTFDYALDTWLKHCAMDVSSMCKLTDGNKEEAYYLNSLIGYQQLTFLGKHVRYDKHSYISRRLSESVILKS